MSRVPCPRCLRANIVREAIQPLPEIAPPRSRDDFKPCCFDCQCADTLVALGYVPTWAMARTVVANGRQEQLRLPGTPIGLVYHGLQRPSEDGDLERHHQWLSDVGLT